MTNTYDKAPELFWYRVKENMHFSFSEIEGEYIRYIHKQKEFVGFLEEPSHQTIDKYDIRYAGKGDISWITTYSHAYKNVSLTK